MRIEEIDGAKLVKNVAQNMEEIFRKKAEATRVSNKWKITEYVLLATVLFLN